MDTVSFDPDKDEDVRAFSLEEKLDEILTQLKRIAKLLEVLTDTEVGPEDVEE